MRAQRIYYHLTTGDDCVWSLIRDAFDVSPLAALKFIVTPVPHCAFIVTAVGTVALAKHRPSTVSVP
jgi:hypothetical protein